MMVPDIDGAMPAGTGALFLSHTDHHMVMIAFLLGGLIGIGTLLCALCLGPFTQFFDRTVSAKAMPAE